MFIKPEHMKVNLYYFFVLVNCKQNNKHHSNFLALNNLQSRLQETIIFFSKITLPRQIYENLTHLL